MVVDESQSKRTDIITSFISLLLLLVVVVIIDDAGNHVNDVGTGTIRTQTSSTTTLKEDDHPIIYNKAGKRVQYYDMVEAIIQKSPDVIFVGEVHDKAICHQLELQLTQDVYQYLQSTNITVDTELVLGAEMFEADQQQILSDYISNRISESTFRNLTRLWPNYDDAYKPLVEFTKQRQLHFVATNIPRQYASALYHSGGNVDNLTQTLTDDELRYMVPLPIRVDMELESYQEILDMTGDDDHDAGVSLVMAQAIKDATMAYFIYKSVGDTHSTKRLMIHYNGSFHSDKYEGIVWYLRELDPNLNVMTISSVEQKEDCNMQLNDDNIGIADFITCVPFYKKKKSSEQTTTEAEQEVDTNFDNPTTRGRRSYLRSCLDQPKFLKLC